MTQGRRPGRGLLDAARIMAAVAVTAFLVGWAGSAVRFDSTFLARAWMWIGLLPMGVAAVAVAGVRDRTVRDGRPVIVAAAAAFGAWALGQLVLTLMLSSAFPGSMWSTALSSLQWFVEIGLVGIAAAWILGHRRHGAAVVAALVAWPMDRLMGSSVITVVDASFYNSPLGLAWQSLITTTVPSMFAVVIACWVAVGLDRVLGATAR